MKKLASIIVALLMVLSVIPLALAQEDGTTSDADMTSDSEQTEQTSTETSDGSETAAETTEEVPAEGTADGTVETTAEETPAETPAEEAPVEEEVEEEAGITPDSPLHGIERALERIDLLLTFGKSAKAKKGLEHARERLMEVRVMQAEKKAAAAAKAAEEYKEIVADVEGNVEAIGNADATADLEAVAEIEAELSAQESLVNQILEAAKSGELRTALMPLSASVKQIKISVKEKKDGTKIKIKALGKSDAEVEALETEIRQKVSEQMGVVASKPKAVKIERKVETKVETKGKAMPVVEPETGEMETGEMETGVVEAEVETEVEAEMKVDGANSGKGSSGKGKSS